MNTDPGSVSQADATAVQAYLRNRARDGPRIGPFSILFTPDDRNPYANYAIPEDDARPSAADVDDLVAAFLALERRPRLEFVPAAAPEVERALLAGGFVTEMRPPLMTRRADVACPQPLPVGFTLKFAETHADLLQAASVVAEAFGGDQSDAGWLSGTAAMGGRVVIAHELQSGEAAGAGALTQPLGGVTEVVGVGVRPAFRRRGMAQAITARLSESAFESGCSLVFLSAAGEEQSEIYARAGFMRRAPMLFMWKLDD